MENTFGGHSLHDLKELRKNPADGGRFYLALLDAAPDLFNLAKENETLKNLIKKMVSEFEDVIGEQLEGDAGGDTCSVPDAALKAVADLLSDPAIQKIAQG
ncbi:MAG: hypothetical protein HQ512_13115 [Rhodospirillales bacterium]|nr:hypothetical protein [Rhodospirillales bacterium]